MFFHDIYHLFTYYYLSIVWKIMIYYISHLLWFSYTLFNEPIISLSISCVMWSWALHSPCQGVESKWLTSCTVAVAKEVKQVVQWSLGRPFKSRLFLGSCTSDCPVSRPCGLPSPGLPCTTVVVSGSLWITQRCDSFLLVLCYNYYSSLLSLWLLVVSFTSAVCSVAHSCTSHFPTALSEWTSTEFF